MNRIQYTPQINMKKIITLGLLIIYFANCTYAQSKWVQTSTPPSGSVWAMASIGNQIFAGCTNGGIYVSSDQGGSWQQRNGAFPSMQVYALATSGSNLYAGTGGSFGAGVYYSPDSAKTWINITPIGMNSSSKVRALAADNNQIFAGTFGGGGVFMSPLNNINPSSWSSFNNGLNNQNIRSLKLSGNTIYAGTYGDGVWYSDIQNANWLLTSASMSLNADYIQALDCNGTTIFAGNISGLPVLYHSTDSGKNWIQSNTPIFVDKPVYALVNDGINEYAGTEGAGIMKSSDQGISWNTYNEGFQDSLGNWYCSQINIRSFAITENYLYAGTDCGVWKREDLALQNNAAYSLQTVNVYPNPNNGIFEIQMRNDKPIDIEIFNIFGLQILSYKNISSLGTFKIDLSAYSKGMFFVKIKEDKKVYSHKLIVE